MYRVKRVSEIKGLGGGVARGECWVAKDALVRIRLGKGCDWREHGWNLEKVLMIYSTM